MMRSDINGGHIFYYVRTDNISLGKLDLKNKTYERVIDFGIVPITFIEGYYPKAHDHFMKGISKDLVNVNNIKHISFQGSLLSYVENTGIPWYLYADHICQNKYKAEELVDNSDINISKFKASQLFYMENYVDYFVDYISEAEKYYYKPINFIVKNLGKEYEILYTVFYDALELHFWHGTTRGFQNLQFVLDNILLEEIVNKIPEVGGFFWRISSDKPKDQYAKFIVDKIKEKEEKEKEKIKKQKMKSMNKKIV